MALAYTLDYIERNHLARLTVYGEFLERFPPKDLVEIRRRTSWSCPHGVGRWRRDCGCQTGGDADWNQKWRRPLREALNWLRDQAAPPFETELGLLLKDPWAARNSYIDVVLDPSKRGRFFEEHSTRSLSPEEQERSIELLELQRNALMMFTSCAWFFNDVSGIETIQILRYARRVVEMGEKLFALKWEESFLRQLSRAESNKPSEGNGAEVYRKYVRSDP
jgi:alpha-amylase/alpha-mannosidase (GH57 family)